MDFGEEQKKARYYSRLLKLLFVGSLIAIVVIFYVLIVSLFYLCRFGTERFQDYFHLWHPDIFILTSVIVVGVVLVAFRHRTKELKKGGHAITEHFRGYYILSKPEDFSERRLKNIVDEIAIAASTSSPFIYIITEDTINAFASGYDPDFATIAITRGCIEKLNREELQAVVAHEFSHILNGDMQTNTHMVGMIFGLSSVSLAGRTLMASWKGAHAVALFIFGFGFICWVIGYIGIFFSRIIQATVLRQREYLADASAVQYTRNPGALLNVLKKIKKYGSTLSDVYAIEALHMLFAEGEKSWFSAHPPLKERMVRIFPSWNRSFTIEDDLEERALKEAERYRMERIKGQVSRERFNQWKSEIKQIPNDYSVAQIVAFLGGISFELSADILQTNGAKLLLCSLFIEKDHLLRVEQIRVLHKILSPDLYAKMLKHHREIRTFDGSMRMTFIDLCLATLNEKFTEEDFQKFVTRVKELALLDENLTHFEFILLVLIHYKLGMKFHSEEILERKLSLKDIPASVSGVLSFLSDGLMLPPEKKNLIFSEWSFLPDFPAITYVNIKRNDWSVFESYFSELRRVHTDELNVFLDCYAVLLKESSEEKYHAESISALRAALIH